MDNINDILKKVKARFPKLSKRMEEAQAVSQWEESVGPQIARYARAVCVKANTLWVEVDHPIWRSELHYRKKQILARLNRGVSRENAIRDLYFIDPRKNSRKKRGEFR